ncbi:YiiX/YebB-like N1pC/P60 family cysteine hydrolase [Sphingobium estronivorans]|uniref:YiiX/YebB-like N1pC/P60 family cysteine hydrolase n=1 Tax=Sphingobium estronivorans TaxID=1577690 RepID=UPI00123A85BE|nr:YiiX/YebB-like N1pC/P60 family cysteine hydrolase [Sphingobium estronivorans]
MPDEEIRRIKVERLRPGDIILTASSGKVSKAIRIASKGQVSHAMICVQHGSIIDSTDDGVQAHNIQRELYEPDDHVAVLRLRQSLTEAQLAAVIDFARSEIGTRYSRSEAVRSVLTGPKPRTRQLFCSRLVGRAFASAGVHLVADPDYCTPEQIRRSPLLAELPDMTETASPAELAAWAARANPIADMQDIQNRILTAARQLDPSVENFNDLDRLVQDHPEWDEEIARVYRKSGYLDLWRSDFAINPWHYDLDHMEASAGSHRDAGLLEYCLSTIREFHTGGLRFAVNLAHYQRALEANGRTTTTQLVALYRQLVMGDQTPRGRSCMASASPSRGRRSPSSADRAAFGAMVLDRGPRGTPAWHHRSPLHPAHGIVRCLLGMRRPGRGLSPRERSRSDAGRAVAQALQRLRRNPARRRRNP